MAKTAALNPASTPFFPGAMRVADDGGRSNGFALAVPTLRDQDRASVSGFSTSPVEHRSIRSSPSPAQGTENLERIRFDPSPTVPDVPSAAHLEPDRPFNLARTREMSVIGSLQSLPEAHDTHGSATTDERAQTPADSPFFSPTIQYPRGHANTPPVSIMSVSSRPSSSFNTNGPFISSSPVSSLDSGSQFTSGGDFLQNPDAQLKASPLIQDIIDRLLRCEFTAQEVQRELRDVHRKVDFLVERSFNNAPQGGNSQPEFKDPFAPAGGQSATSLTIPRASFSAGIAPNQSPPPDDISQISQRLNTLTTSVGQLLALQTQQHLQGATALGRLTTHTPDLPPNQPFGANISPNPALLGHGLPNRPELRAVPRAPNPPARTWSAGNLDLPLRVDSVATLGRSDPVLNKRRSVTGGLMRRESVGIIDGQGSDWPGGAPRDNGPVVSKWEQLNLAPDLLRSLKQIRVIQFLTQSVQSGLMQLVVSVGPPNKIQQRALPFLLRGSDIIAQAPPTQERIAAYVIPAIQVAVVNTTGRPPNRGPLAVMVSTTVDQATQAQRMIRDLGGPIGIRSALGVGMSTNANDLTQELRLLQQNMPHIICGTPQKLHALFTFPGGLIGSEVRLLVLDEVDQLIARNLHEFVFNIVKLLPPPRSRPAGPGTPLPSSNSSSQSPFASFDTNNPLAAAANSARRYSTIPSSPPSDLGGNSSVIERQTALFSNTVPQDVLNLATAIQLREPVRVLVRRDGNVTSTETNQGSRGLRQFYLYLAFTAGGRADSMNVGAPGSGHGIIGSGRGASSVETTQAREWKLDALADIFDDCRSQPSYRPCWRDECLGFRRIQTGQSWVGSGPAARRNECWNQVSSTQQIQKLLLQVMMRQPVTKVLIVNDVQVKIPEISHVPLIINYDLPKAVEEYAHRVAPAIASSYSRAGVIINFVTATGRRR
ncbi:hypothetical protein EV363DRAFT_1580323 [Boletus edulis]|nr:hypothetical protein EV363DRAFT_1580323 [Boletus edulis]